MRSREIIMHALEALLRGDEGELRAVARSIVRIPKAAVAAAMATGVGLAKALARWEHFVMLALWESRDLVLKAKRPKAYLQRVAYRLMISDEGQERLQGVHIVTGAHGKTIGRVQIGSYNQRNNTINDDALTQIHQRGAGALGFEADEGVNGVEAASHCCQTAELKALWRKKFEVLDYAGLDEDEREMVDAHLRGVSLREMGAELRWEKARVERVRKRLYRAILSTNVHTLGHDHGEGV